MPEIIAILPVLFYAGYTDYRYRIIHNKASVFLIIIGAAEVLFFNEFFHTSLTERLLISVSVFLLFYLAYRLKPGSTGGGDVKLFASLGVCLGIKVLTVLILSCIAGIVYWAVTKDKKIPMGSAAFAGAILAVVLENIVKFF